jgi:hypothetical protein
MSEPHIIRLRGPWDAQPIDGSHLKRWTRRFGRPTGPGSGEQVWLCLQPADRIQSWRLNDVELQAVGTAGAIHRCDVTDQLPVRSQLEVIVKQAPEPSREQPPFEVWLEIISMERRL